MIVIVFNDGKSVKPNTKIMALRTGYMEGVIRVDSFVQCQSTHRDSTADDTHAR